MALSNGFSLEEEKEVAAENDRPSLSSGNSDDKSERLLLFDNEKLFHSDEPSRNNNNGKTEHSQSSWENDFDILTAEEVNQIPFARKKTQLHVFFISLIVIQLTDVIVVTSLLVGDLSAPIQLDIGILDSVSILFNLSKCFLLICYCYVNARDKKQGKNHTLEQIVGKGEPPVVT